MREHASEPRDYEMMIVVDPTVGDEGLPAAIERVSGYVTSQGGTVNATNNENPWGRRRLAYQINDHRDAFYVLYRFVARPEAIIEIEREMKLDDSVIRYLVVRYDELTEHEERAPRQQPGADGPGGPGGPGGPSFRRPRTDAAPAAPQAAAPESAATESTATESTATESTASESTASESTASESAATEPSAPESAAVEPAAEEPTAEEPTEASDPDAESTSEQG